MTRFHRTLTFRLMAFLGASAALGAGCDTLRGSGNARQETRSLAAFDAVEVSAGLVVHVSQGPQEVTLRGDDNLLDEVSTEVIDGVLVIRPLRDLDPVVPLVVTVRAPELQRLSLRAGGRLEATGLDVPELELSLAAGGDLRVSGTVEALTARLSGGGTVDAARLVSNTATLHGEGGGEIRITATRSVDGLITSGTQAIVYGQPADRAVTTDAGGSVAFR